MARPSGYRPEYAAQAVKLCKLGLIDKEIAKFFDVAEQTLYNWKLKHPEFMEALKGAKTFADAEVAAKLFHRATGYDHPEVDIRVIDGQIVQTPLIKHYAPDTTAAIFWLKNRRPDLWRDKLEADTAVEGQLKQVDLERKKIELERLKASGGSSMEAILRELIGKLPG